MKRKKVKEKNELKNEGKIKIPIENVDEIMEKLNSGVIPKQLEFFKGGVNIKFEKTVLSLGIDEK